ncbi:MAG: MFS transporter [Ignavibacterium sp.]|jgi:MFS family permease|nr:MFS transporter [Ignavibacterium sp.]
MSENQTAQQTTETATAKSIIRELTQPFKDLFKASRALWGINLSYLLEGITYFGVVGYLVIYFTDFIKLDDIRAGQMVGFQTAGITLAMLFLGATVDWIGVRKSLLYSLGFMLIGRVFLTLVPDITSNTGLWSSAHLIAMLGLLGIILGYGIYQPACYAAVKQFTNEKTAAMGYAMLYAIMNLGGFLPGIIAPPIRQSFQNDREGMLAVMWVYVGLTVLGIIIVAVILTKKTIEKTILEVSVETKEKIEADKKEEEEKSSKEKILFYLKNFPIKDARFMYFIFILIPVQTLFAHNWLTLPVYYKRAFTGVVSDNFEFFTNFNPLLIFILTPMVAALTVKRDTYKMMILGTFVMAFPTFILTLGPTIFNVFAFLILMTIGEAMWQPRFLQWVAEIAPKGMTGIYMGIGQFPWFLTKVVTSLYSGWFLMTYAPDGIPPEQMNTETMWFIYGCIAMVSTIGLLLARKWMMKGFKVKHEG